MWVMPPITNDFLVFGGKVNSVFPIIADPRNMSWKKCSNKVNLEIAYGDVEGDILAQEWGWENNSHLWAGIKKEIYKPEVQQERANSPYRLDIVGIDWIEKKDKEIINPIEFKKASDIPFVERSEPIKPRKVAEVQGGQETYEDACKRIFGAKPIMKSVGKWRK